MGCLRFSPFVAVVLTSLSMVSTASAQQSVPVPSSGAYLGLLSSLPGLTNTESIKHRESQFSRTFAIDSRYFDWGDGYPTSSQAWDVAGGRIPMITWWWPQHYSDINDGSQDSLIRARAQAVKAFGSPIFLRPAAEMNGDWFDWGGANNDRDTAAFIKAWRRIHDIFDEEGVHNVSWVWAPNSESSPGGWDPSSWNSWRNYYPGDAYVDWVGIDGYNWGLLPGGDGWLSFGAIMQHVYDDYATRKPIMIAETGSTESGGDKAQWISDMGTWVKAHPAIKAVVYFDRVYTSTGHDWGIDTSTASSNAFAKFAADPYFGVLAQSPDAAPPDTTITSGPSGKITTVTATFGFASSEAGSSFQCRLDSASWSGCNSPKTYSGLTDGAHTFAVRATDQAGNTDTSPATRDFTVETSAPGPPPDTTPPDTTIISGPTGTITTTSATFAFSSSEAESSFQCRLDSASWSGCNSPKTYSGLTEGAHAFTVRASDQAGNTDTSPATRNFTVDTSAPESPPDTTITSGPTGTITSGKAHFTFVSSEAGSTFQCRLDSASWSGCSSPNSYNHLSQGTHTFYVRAQNRAGTVDPSSASRAFTVGKRAARAKVFARKVQRKGHRVRVTVKLTPKKQVAVRVTGEVELGRVKPKLRPQSERIGAGERVTLALKLRKRRDNKKVVGALEHHKKVKATVKVRFTEEV